MDNTPEEVLAIIREVKRIGATTRRKYGYWPGCWEEFLPELDRIEDQAIIALARKRR